MYATFLQANITIALISSFLVIFYFLYVVRVESAIVATQTKSATAELCNELKSISPKIAHSVSKLITLPPTDHRADQRSADNNRAIRAKSIKFIGIFLMIQAFIVVVLSRYLTTTILIDSLLTASITALTEFCFLKLVIQRYIVFDSHRLKFDMLDTFEKLF